MAIIVSDKKLFAVILYSAFANYGFLTSVRDIWKNSWVTDSLVTGIAGDTVLGLVDWVIAPMILSVMIDALEISVLARLLLRWVESTIKCGRVILILHLIEIAGLGTIINAFGAALGILIKAVCDHKFADNLNEIVLIERENQMLEYFVQIKEDTFQNNSMVIFILMPALLYNDVMLKLFVETFTTGSCFSSSKLFRFNFEETDLLSEEERVNHTIYNLLISNYEESRVEYIFHDDYLIGYNLNLSDHNCKINSLVEVWKYINIHVDKKILHQIHKFKKNFHL